MPNPSPFYFLLFFVSLWLVVTTMLSVLSGWLVLAKHYPDQNETALFTIGSQSGSMGLGVRMNHILTLSVCPSGLRIGIMRIFGPFCRDFLVPWNDLSVERRTSFFLPIAELRFGRPSRGRLIIANYLANRLAKSAGASWPETLPLLTYPRGETARAIFLYWLLGTVSASGFFLIVPRLAAPRGMGPPWWVAICFPAVVFGIMALVRYYNSVKTMKD